MRQTWCQCSEEFSLICLDKLEVPEVDGAEEVLGLGTLSDSTEDVPGVLATVY